MGFERYLRREERDRELREEIESYVQNGTDENIARGMTPDEAAAAARRKFGNCTFIREEVYSMNSIGILETLNRNVRHTLRTLRRNPTFVGAALLTLALAIGANTAVFTVVNSVLLRPLPYPNADELVDIHQVAPGAFGVTSLTGGLNLSASLYFTYAEQNRTFQKLGIWIPGTAAVTGVAEPEQVRVVAVSDGTLDALNVRPALGRSLSTADQALSSPETLMLGYGYWQKRFGGDKSVIGRTLRVDSRPRVIVGVMPRGFRIADTPADLILPFRFDRRQLMLAGFSFPGIGRLKPGVSIAQANADLARLIPVWMNSWPSIIGARSGDPLATKVYAAWRITPALRPLRDSIVGNVGAILWVVMGTLGIVLLIAAANVANLLLVRAAARQQELGVRAALGAGWGRNARELLVESMLLACGGAALGTGLAYTGLRLLVRIGPANLPRLSEISLDMRALAFTVGVALLSGLLLGIIPALKYAAPGITAALRSEGRGSTGNREHNRTRNILVVAQVALALILLIGSSLMIRTFYALRRVDPGFSGAAQLQTFRVAIPEALVATPEMVTRTENAIVDKLRTIPGVTSAAFASALPMDGGPPDWDAVFKEGQDYVPGEAMTMRLYVNVSPGFLHTSGTRLIAGRDFTWNDLYGTRPYVMISENLAREWWGSAAAAVGKRIRANPNATWREVIGVVEDVHSNGAHEPAPTTVYWPSMMALPWTPNKVVDATRNAAFVVRSGQAGSAGLLDEVQRDVWSVNAALPLAETSTMKTIYDRSMARTSFTLAMLAIAGAMALVLGIVGIYGVIAYAVSQRSREIGIRAALGARPGELKEMFLRHALTLAAVGVAIGLAAAAGLTQLMKSLLFGISPVDPVTYAAMPLVLIAAAALASYLPARRAAMVDPVDTLRAE